MTEPPVPHIRGGALISDRAAYIIAKLLPDRERIAQTLNASPLDETYREDTLLAIEAIELEAKRWQLTVREQQRHQQAASAQAVPHRKPHAESRPASATASLADMVNTATAASDLDLTTRQVTALAATGKLGQSTKNGRDWQIDAAAVADYKPRKKEL